MSGLRPPWIGLAHELVHAWRFVAGHYNFTGNDLADQQLATGVPPYMLGKYNKNGMRYYAFGDSCSRVLARRMENKRRARQVSPSRAFRRA